MGDTEEAPEPEVKEWEEIKEKEFLTSENKYTV
jgi:hypothetical protein